MNIIYTKIYDFDFQTASITLNWQMKTRFTFISLFSLFWLLYCIPLVTLSQNFPCFFLFFFLRTSFYQSNDKCGKEFSIFIVIPVIFQIPVFIGSFSCIPLFFFIYFPIFSLIVVSLFMNTVSFNYYYCLLQNTCLAA